MFGKYSGKLETWSVSPSLSQAEAIEVVSGVLEHVVREVVGRGGVQEAGKSKVQEPCRGEVQEPGRGEVQEHGSGRGEVQKADRDGVQKAGKGGVQEAGKGGVQEAGRGEVQEAEKGLGQEAGKGEVQELSTSSSGVREVSRSEVRKVDRSAAKDANRSNILTANRSMVQEADKSRVQHANRNTVQGAGISGVQEGNKGGAVQAQKKASFSPGWFEDDSLPPGWRSCVPAPKKVMYYSPCGSLFTSRAQVDKFLGVRKTDAVVKKPTSQFGPGKKVEQHGRGRQVKESLLGKKAPIVVKRVEVSKVGYDGEIIEDVKKVKTPAKKKLNTGKQLNVSSPQLECDGNSTSSDGAISLSDEDFLSEESPKGKRKMKQRREGPSPKKLCFGKKTFGKEMAAKIVAVQEAHKVTEAQEAIQVTEAQEKILLAAFGQWPVAIPELEAALMEETGLTSGAVRGWFLQTREDCIDLLWATCK